jgi:hypothetical protein
VSVLGWTFGGVGNEVRGIELPRLKVMNDLVWCSALDLSLACYVGRWVIYLKLAYSLHLDSELYWVAGQGQGPLSWQAGD